jgi:hypothetical protein
VQNRAVITQFRRSWQVVAPSAGPSDPPSPAGQCRGDTWCRVASWPAVDDARGLGPSAEIDPGVEADFGLKVALPCLASSPSAASAATGSASPPAATGSPLPSGLVSEPAGLLGLVGTVESSVSAKFASVPVVLGVPAAARWIGAIGWSACSVSARRGTTGWAGAASLELTSHLELTSRSGLVLVPSAAMCPPGAGTAGAGMGCGVWRLATMDWVVADAGKTVGCGWTPATDPGAATRLGPVSWLRTGDGLLASGATSPSLTNAEMPRIPPPASAKQAAAAALAARVFDGSDAGVRRRWLAATVCKWGSAPIHAINALAGGPEPALRRWRAVSSCTLGLRVSTPPHLR